jgi:hypothetical protein
MPFLNVGANGNDLTLQLPTRSTTDWADEFLTNFAAKISTHDHTGAGRGAQLGSGAFANSSITADKILLANNTALKWRDSALLIQDVMKLNSSNLFEILYPIISEQIISNKEVSLVNNTTDQVILELGSSESIKVEYKIKRIGTDNKEEKGEILINNIDGSYIFSKEYIGDVSGATFKIVGSQLLVDLNDNVGSSSESIFLQSIKLGV